MVSDEPGKKTGDTAEVSLKYLVMDMALDLRLLVASVLIILLAIYLPFLSTTPIRPAFGLLMVLFIPGYALVAALFPEKSDIGSIERAALSVGVSIAISSLVGLVFNYTPWGIRIDSVAIGLSAISILLIMLANYRRHIRPGDRGFAMDASSVIARLKNYIVPASSSRLDRQLSLVLAALVIFSILMTIYILSVPKHGESFTELYITSTTGKAENYPTQYYLGERKPVLVGVVNHEYRNATYDLVVNLDTGEQSTVLYTDKFNLTNSQKWENKVFIQPDRAGKDFRVNFLLYIDGNLSAPYRENHMWINVTEPDYDNI